MPSFSRPRYDVAIAGASFAGLAAALAAAGGSRRILLLDYRPIGEGQTSACGTTLAALDALEARETVQQVHDDLVLHLTPAGGPERVLRYRLPYRFATFDYGALCRLLGRRAQAHGVEFVQARVLGWQGDRLQTDLGAVDARCVVDATGWRASVASSIDPRHVRRDLLSCGLEAELPSRPPTTPRGCTSGPAGAPSGPATRGPSLPATSHGWG